MPAIQIYGPQLQGRDKRRLLDLLESAGQDVNAVKHLDGIPGPVEGPDDVVMIVMLTPDVASNPNLEAELAAATKGGTRVVCIWPEQAPDEPAPTAVEKY